MICTKKRKLFCIGLIVLNVGFIWINSLLPREISAAFSRLVGSIINYFFPGPDIPPSGEGHGILRKVAHFMEFCSLGLLLSWLMWMVREKKWQRFAIPAAAGVLVAAIDETIQCFVPGRGPGLLDVGIDSAGVLLGILLFAAIQRIRKKYPVEKP